MRALRRKRKEPGLAEERRSLVHRYMGDATDPVPPAGGELRAEDELEDVDQVEDVSFPTAAATYVELDDVETPPSSNPEPRPDSGTDLPRAVVPEPPALRAVGTAPHETLQPSTFAGALETLEEVRRLCEQLARLRDERGRRQGLLAEVGRQLVLPPGSSSRS